MHRTMKDWFTVIAAAAIVVSLFAFVLMVRPAAAQSCSELRKACLDRGELGERGQGNCRRYREACTDQGSSQQGQGSQQQGGGSRGPNCAALAVECRFKNELQLEGTGRCRAFHDNCN